MPISHKFKLIFIHIPKNAGESIEKTFGMYGDKSQDNLWGVAENRIVLQHLTAERLKLRISNDKIWNNYFKFAVVRNPWSKAVSEYNWYLRFGPTIPFYRWVDTLKHRLKCNDSINILEVGHNIEQHKFMFDNEGKLLVNKILRFEILQQEFEQLCSDNNWKLNLHNGTETSGPGIPFEKYYDEETAKKIEDIYFEDLKKFNYSIENTFLTSGFREKPFEVSDMIAAKILIHDFTAKKRG